VGRVAHPDMPEHKASGKVKQSHNVNFTTTNQEYRSLCTHQAQSVPEGANSAFFLDNQAMSPYVCILASFVNLAQKPIIQPTEIDNPREIIQQVGLHTIFICSSLLMFKSVSPCR
jgi:hypothetical protein